jgi:outer membrane protein assembly factor BamB
VSGDLVVFASTDGYVYALKAAKGKEVWHYATDRPIVASPRAAGGVVYIGSSETTSTPPCSPKRMASSSTALRTIC